MLSDIFNGDYFVSLCGLVSEPRIIINDQFPFTNLVMIYSSKKRFSFSIQLVSAELFRTKEFKII